MTYTTKQDDINFFIGELERLQACTEDLPVLKKFAEKHAAPLIELLEELRQARSEETGRKSGLIAKHMHRIIVEGYSDVSINAAFADALEKVSPYFSEHHDVDISVIGLQELPRGGHRATLEVHLTPMTSNKTQHMEGQDVERRHIKDRHYKIRKKYEENHLKHLIHDHFLTRSGQTPDVPDYFLIDINDAELLNMMIEKEFFHATHNDDMPAPGTHHHPRKIMVRVNNPDEA